MERWVLVIEDHPVNLQLAQFLLERAGFRVAAAATAQEGIAKARLRPHLILMDIELPGMDGLAATRLLKSDPATADIPVVAMTANAMQGDRERCMGAGCDWYICKPIDTREFMRTVQRWADAGNVGHA